MKKKTKPPTPRPKTTAKKVTGSASPLNLGLLEELVKLMSTNDLNTIELRDGDQRVLLKRGGEVVQTISSHVATPHASSQSSSVPTAAPVAPVKADDDAGLIAIKSPMVGTFYARPNPDSKNFVSVGSLVNEETDVCIIEAMKVFNNIKAETKGTITKVVVEDGKPVEFGQVMFLVKPS